MGITEIIEPSDSPFTQFSLIDSPTQLLSNWYHLAAQVLTTGTSLQFYPVNNSLTKYTNTVGDKYRYFRCDLEIALIMRSSPLYYGSVIFVWYPADFPAGQSLRNSDPVVMDISTGGTTIVQIPYSAVNEAYEVTTADIGDGYRTPKVSCDIQCPYVRSLNAAMPSPQLHIMTRMVNPVFYGTTTRTGVSQMDRQMMSADRTLTNPYMTSALVAGMGTMGAAYHLLGAVNSYFKAGTMVYKEGAEAASHVNGLMKSISGFFERDKVATSDPRDIREAEQEGEMRNAPTPVGYLPSLSYNVQDSLDPLSSFRIKPVHLADSLPCHKILDICRIPTINRDFVWTSTAQNFDMMFSPLLLWGGIVHGWPYLSLMAQHFRFWRGSFDLDLLFFTSPLISGRLVINFWNEGPTLTKPAATVNATYHYLKRVNVSGFSRVSLKVPFVYPTQWCPTYPYMGDDHILGTENVPMSMNIHLESDIVGGGDQAPEIYMMVLISAGDDFQLRSVQGTSIEDHTPSLILAKGKRKEKNRNIPNAC